MRLALPKQVARLAGRTKSEQPGSMGSKAEDTPKKPVPEKRSQPPSDSGNGDEIDSSESGPSSKVKCEASVKTDSCKKTSDGQDGSIDHQKTSGDKDAKVQDLEGAHLVMARKIWRFGTVFEHYLPRNMCQSLLDGRNGSSACTVIASLVVRKVLAERVVVPKDSDRPTTSCVNSFVECMRSGNRLYDDARLGGAFTSVYDALTLLPSDTGISRRGDKYARDAAGCVRLFTEVGKQAVAEGRDLGDVFVHHPLSLAIIFQASGSAAVFDSHSHPLVRQGALIAVLRQRKNWRALADHVCELFRPNKIRDCNLALLEYRSSDD